MTLFEESQHAYLRTPIRPGSLDWVAEITGFRVVHARFLTGGISHSNYALTLDRAGGPRVVLRRWVRPGWQDDDPDFTVEREAAALDLLGRAGIAAPRLIATDPGGVRNGVPALLMTWLHGRPPVDVPSSGALRQYAEAAAVLHRIEPPWDGIPAYRPYNDLVNPRPPALSDRADVWRRAFDAVADGPPEAPARFIHRDYHPGNTLWAGGRLTAIVDWTSASVGPAGIDVGHMCWNLAVRWGAEAAGRFLDHCRAIDAAAGDRYWRIRTVVDLLPYDHLDRTTLNALEPYLAGLIQ